MISRLTSKFDINTAGKIILVYGFVNDIFVSNDLIIHNLDLLLWRYLKSNKISRIIFFDSTKRIRLFDQESLDLFIESTDKTSQNDENRLIKPTTETQQRGGPLSKSGLSYLSKTTNNNANYRNNTHQPTTFPFSYNINDTNVLSRLNHAFRNKDIRTAIIFSNFQQDYYQNTVIKSELLNLITNWNQLYDNKNKCFLIFQDTDIESLKETLKNKDYPFFINILNTDNFIKKNTIDISYPDNDEIFNLIQRYRIIQDKSIEWIDQEEIIKNLSTSQLLMDDINQRLSLFNGINLKEILSSLEKKKVSEKTAIQRLNELIGLQKAKNQVRDYIDLIKFNKKNNIIVDERLHLVFKGNPGTGKTTVARLIGEIFREENILPRGHFHEVKRVDLVAGFVGQTANKVQDAFSKAKGGVLFIDEAYSLINGDNDAFGKEAIDTILPLMENNRKDTLVILAGYPDDIDKLLNANPGFKSRIGDTIYFEDYNPEELLQILILTASKNHFSISDEALTLLKNYFIELHNTRDSYFGNAREIENIWKTIKINSIKRINDSGLLDTRLTILSSDLPKEFIPQTPLLTEIIQSLNGLIGIKKVKETVIEIVRSIEFDRKFGLPKREATAYHFVFSGNPGTGKTTVARLMGEIFRSLGILRRGHIIEVKREDLVAGFIGQTAEKTKNVVKKAIDGILFIDEAYSLTYSDTSNDFGNEVINVLTGIMDEYRDRLVVIVAGYTKEMNIFINSNPGLKSRFKYEILFDDFDDDELWQIFLDLSSKDSFKVLENTKDIFVQTISNIRKTANQRSFGNARDVRKYWEKVKDRHKSRVISLNRVSAPKIS